MSTDNETVTNLASPLHQPAADYVFLRQQGIRQLEQLSGMEWTDFNPHDPGITILEQLCYALTDIGYRAEYALPDLLSREGEDPYASIYTPAQILPTSPVSIADLRKLVIDVPGVKNAWIDIIDQLSASFDAAKGEVNVAGKDAATEPLTPSPNVSEIRVKGLLSVRIEKSDVIDIDAGSIRLEAARRLHRYRGLGQDFQTIEVLDQQPIRLVAVLEIDAPEDATALLASLYQRIAEYMSPSVPFHTLKEMQQRGRRMDEIFEGPLLEHGFIDPDELAQLEWRSSLRISDLIRELMMVPGVEAVQNLRFLAPDGRPTQDWLLSIEANMTPRFDLQNSDIRLEKRGLRIDQATMRDAAKVLFIERAKMAASPVRTPATERDLHPLPGRDRFVANYYSVQQQFPMAYGIGVAGLSQSAPTARKAQAKQLKAYMMFYDQLLANQFAQLANVGKLFSFHDETPDSYFSQAVPDDGTLGLDAVRNANLEEHRLRLQRFTEDPLMNREKTGARRRNRFLDHLLARFGEQFHNYALLRSGIDSDEGMTYEERLACDKRAFLRDYSRIGRDRGLAFNYLEPTGDQNISGLELALRRKLGVADSEQRFYLVEHVLLRPIAGDLHQHAPLFRDAKMRDPYSLQITLVFPNWPSCYQNQAFVEQTVREETPAHLTAHFVWKDEVAMQIFESAFAEWLHQWRNQRCTELGL